MKITILSTTFLAYAMVMVSAAALPEDTEPATVSADGAYSSELDAEGNEVVQFIPWNELGNKSFVPITTVIPAPEIAGRAAIPEHHGLEKRKKQGCLPKSITRDQWKIDEANNCVYHSVSDPFVFLGGGNKRHYCVRQGITSFICSYGANRGEPTVKDRDDLRWTWDYIRLVVCGGKGRLGHSEIPNGYGLVSAGYTYEGDKFCW
ncbi:hypothetical protein V8F20_006942 [Naviculisporaceae sp. PSN 640]